jgi:hypothetical protein
MPGAGCATPCCRCAGNALDDLVDTGSLQRLQGFEPHFFETHHNGRADAGGKFEQAAIVGFEGHAFKPSRRRR